MRNARVAAAAILLVLAGVGAGTIDSTSSAYVDSATNSGNSFATAPDWTAPAAASSVIVKSGGGDPGYIRKGGGYYVYSSVSDTGNPAAGVASVKADASAITAGQSAVTQVSGTWSAGGVAYNYRTPLLTANGTLAAGVAPWSLTSSDTASPANVATQSFSGTVDNTAPTATNVQTTNITGGTIGKPEQGDTVTYSTSEPLDPQAILSGWLGASTPVIAAIIGSSGNDSLSIYDKTSTVTNPITLPLGTVNLGRSDYVGNNNALSFGFTGTASTMTRVGNSIVIVLGTPSATAGTAQQAGALVWSPSNNATDRAGNAMSLGTSTESGTSDKDF